MNQISEVITTLEHYKVVIRDTLEYTLPRDKYDMDAYNEKKRSILIELDQNTPLKSIITNSGENGENMEILLTIDSESAVKRVFSEKNDGKQEETALLMDCPPQIINGRTMIPLRFVSENFGRRVDWDPETLEVSIDL